MEKSANGGMVQAMLEVEAVSALPAEETEGMRRVKIPLFELAAGGTTLASLSEALRTATMVVPAEGLFKIDPRGCIGTLSQFADGSGFTTMVRDAGNNLVGHVAYVPAKTTTAQLAMPVSPAALFMTAALTSINQKLDAIQQAQQELLDFVAEDKKASLRGNLNTLTDILNGYAQNWDNEKYTSSRHLQALAIQRESEKAIEFYRARARKTLGARTSLLGGKTVQDKLKKLIDDFKEYQIALYLYGFATFLDVMLLGNFTEDYLGSVLAKLRRHANDYRALYTDAFNGIESDAASSAGSHLLGGIAKASKAIGAAIGNVPLVNKGTVDDALAGIGEHLDELKESRPAETAAALISQRDSRLSPFIETVETVSRLANHPGATYFDKDNVYLELPSEA